MATNIGRTDRSFAAWITAAILLVVLAGFSRSFFLRPLFGGPPDWAAKEAVFVLHGLVFTAWYVVLAAQIWLVRAGRIDWHRRLGWAGLGIGVAVIIVGTLSALWAANRPGGGFIGVPVPPDQFLIIPLLGMALFALFLGLAVINRRRAASHKRWMLLASIAMLGAPVARLTLMYPALPFWLDAIVYTGFVALMAAWDWRSRQRVRPETLWGGLSIVILNIAALPFAAASPAWQSLARSLMGLAGAP